MKLFSILLIFCIALTANETKEKLEIIELKKELNDFYNKKELQYDKSKKDLEAIFTSIEKEKLAIKTLRDENLKILQDIKGTIENKTTKIYNKMKSKIAASIFEQMIKDGDIDLVFDIIIKLKEKNVTTLMKFLSPKSASMITKRLQEFKSNKG